MPPKFYLPQEADGLLKRVKVKWIARRKPLPDFPLHAQIQTVSGCNADCIFCPNGKTTIEIKPNRRMDQALFEKIARELIDNGIQRISPYLMNEPTMDPELPERVAFITKHKQNGQFTKINSHGNMLSEKMAKGLLDSGLDRINFSVQGLDPVIYEDVMRLKLEKTLRNIDRMLELKRAGNYKTTRIRVCMLLTEYLEPQLPNIRAYWNERGVKINVNQLENRGHHQKIKSDEIAAKDHELKPYDWCDRLFNQVYILFDGRMVQCCADWEQTGMMGNVSQQTVREIWNGPVYREYRNRFIFGPIKGMLCDGCTKDAVGDEDE